MAARPSGPQAPGRRWLRLPALDQAGVLFVLVASWAVVPKILQTLTAAKYRVRVGEAAPPPTLPTVLATDLLTVALLGFCLLVALDALRRNPRRELLGVCLLLLPWLVTVVRGWTLGTLPSATDLVYPAVVVAVWLVRPGLAHLRLLGHLVAAVAVVSVVLGLVLPDQAVFRAADGSEISEMKSVLPIGVLVGIFTHGNTLGQYLLMGLPLVALVRRGAVRVVLLGVTAFALLWSAARGEIAGAVALAVVTGVLALLPRDRRSVPTRLLLWSAFALVAVLPFVVTSPGAFTARGVIWRASLSAWRKQWWFGNGASYYTDVAATSANLGGTVYHGHNEMVQLLVTGGVVLAASVVPLVLLAVRRAADAAGAGLTPFALLFAVASASLLEVSFQPLTTAVFDPVLLLPLATLVVGRPPAPGRPDDPAQAEAGPVDRVPARVGA